MSKSPKDTPRLIKELDEVYSIHLRMKAADKDGMVKCYTCPKVEHWSKMHCGHFQSRKHRIIRWLDRNTKPQCVGCNIFKYGEQFEFGKNLDLEYGPGTAEELQNLAKRTCTKTKADIIYLIDYYKTEIKNLEK